MRPWSPLLSARTRWIASGRRKCAGDGIGTGAGTGAAGVIGVFADGIGVGAAAIGDGTATAGTGVIGAGIGTGAAIVGKAMRVRPITWQESRASIR